MTVGMVLLAHGMTVIRVRMPLQAPATVDVAVVLPPPEIKRANKGRRERDVGERPADEVVAAVRRPVDEVMESGKHEFPVDSGRRSLRRPSSTRGDRQDWCRP